MVESFKFNSLMCELVVKRPMVHSPVGASEKNASRRCSYSKPICNAWSPMSAEPAALMRNWVLLLML